MSSTAQATLVLKTTRSAKAVLAAAGSGSSSRLEIKAMFHTKKKIAVELGPSARRGRKQAKRGRSPSVSAAWALQPNLVHVCQSPLPEERLLYLALSKRKGACGKR